MSDRQLRIKEGIGQTVLAIMSLRDPIGYSELDKVCNSIIATLKAGGKVMTCGNGGSACDAAHLAEELLGRFKKNRKPFAAINLAGDGATMTCIGNDYGFDEIFSRQVEGLGKPGDVLVVFSTSGNSPDVTYAVTQAKAMGIATVALVGKLNQGGRLANLADAVIKIESEVSSCIQEAHQVCVHLIMEEIEKAIE